MWSGGVHLKEILGTGYIFQSCSLDCVFVKNPEKLKNKDMLLKTLLHSTTNGQKNLQGMF